MGLKENQRYFAASYKYISISLMRSLNYERRCYNMPLADIEEYEKYNLGLVEGKFVWIIWFYIIYLFSKLIRGCFWYLNYFSG